MENTIKTSKKMENRIIKFRAWNGTYMIDPSYGDWISFDGVPYTEASNKFDTPNTEIQKAREYVLMQFTGLKDSKGVEIWESDVIKTPNGNVCEIKWDTVHEEWNGQVFKYTGFALRTLKFNTLYHLDYPETFEVIGNIYSNPELLQDKP